MFSLAFLMLMISCVDENLMSCDDNVGGVPVDETGYGLALHIGLESMTRTGDAAEFEDDEDFINPQLISLYFFYDEKDEDDDDDGGDDSNYNTLIRQFTGDDLTFIPIRSTADGTLKNWYVRIKETDDFDEFAEIVRNNNFKVAVVANWDADKIPSFNPGDNINKFHHLTTDDYYFRDEDRKDVYGFLENHTYPGALGQYKDWVESNLQEIKDDAAGWIKENWYPSKVYQSTPADGVATNPGDVNRPYKDLRLIWNFNAAYRGEDGDYNPSADFGTGFKDNSYARLWAKKNYTDLHAWFTGANIDQSKKDSYGDIIEDLAPITTDNGGFQFVGNNTENAHPDEMPRYVTEGRAAVQLPGTGDWNKNAIKLRLVNSGYISIDWESIDGGELVLESRNSESTTLVSQQEVLSTSGFVEKAFERTINADTEYLTIYCRNGKARIYSIDYIKDKYLYETDRSGKAVSQSNPIPMYGVQSYKKLKNFWKPGTLFNLSNFNRISMDDDYENKEVYMLRAVAKIELKIPKSFDPHHIYLRSVNRNSRFEPMDVSTPTNEIWVDDNLSHNRQNDGDCEWFNIRKIPPFYTGLNTTTYQNKLAWYYGSWSQDNGRTVGEEGNNVEIYNDWKNMNIPYPRIMNPMINRSDFAEFIYTGESDGIYNRYVLYVPEKFVDDPNNVGLYKNKNGTNPEPRYMENETPKVCHIEFRRGIMDQSVTEDPWDNIDDNNCYRIYFHKDGYNHDENLKPNFTPDADGNIQSWERKYEQNVENLKQHWPIMRNHVYSFTVKDASHSVVVVKLEVLPWKNVDNNIYEW